MNDNDNNGKKYHDQLGKFASGNPGRPVGSKNRNAIKSFVLSKVENLDTWFDGLENDRERLDSLIKLLPYAFPRLQAISQVDSEGRDIHTGLDITKLSDSAISEILNASTYEQTSNHNSNRAK